MIRRRVPGRSAVVPARGSRRLLGLGLAAVTAATVALAGCGSGSGSDDASASPGAGGGAFPVTVTAGGEKVTVDRRPTRVVSLSPTTTEMLYAVGAGRQVKAVDDQSNYPKNAPRTKLSGFQPNVEAIAKYDPDLVVLSYQSGDVVSGLRKLKIPVYVAPAATALSGSYREITDLGRLTGHAGGAAATVRTMRTGIAAAEKGLPKRHLTYYYELDPQLHSVTSKTFVGALLSPLGLTNVADRAPKASSGYPALSKEFVVRANPDLIFLADTRCCAQNAPAVASRPGWNTMTAVTDGHVVELNDDIASRWGPRVVDLVRAAAKAVKSVK